MRSRPNRLAVVAVIISLMSSVIGFAPSTYAQDEGEAAAVKARFIITFLNYIKNIKPANTACVIGSETLADSLKTINSKVNKLKEIKNISGTDAEIKSCSIVYFSADVKDQIAKAIDAIKSDNIVTISDSHNFVNDGGIIELYEKEGRMTFAVNSKKAKASGLSLDSKLVELADKVI